MQRLLVIEDGAEYVELARLMLADAFLIDACNGAAEALDLFRRAMEIGQSYDALLIDLRFDRAPRDALIGDVEAVADEHFGGDRSRALRYVEDQQGTLILAALRGAGCKAPALFIQDFSPRRLTNLRHLYGDVKAVPNFDGAAIRRALGVPVHAASPVRNAAMATISGRDALAKIAHDVGKHVTRAARNLPDGATPEAVLRMLVADLFALQRGRRASEVLAELRAEAAGGAPGRFGRRVLAALDAAEMRLGAIDALENGVRAGREDVVRDAARLALEVGELLSHRHLRSCLADDEVDADGPEGAGRGRHSPSRVGERLGSESADDPDGVAG